MKICNILSVEKIIPEFEVESKDEIINQLIDLIGKDENVSEVETVRKAVLDREKIMSTGVGKGFAIPHAKTDGVKNIICGFARTSNPIDFEALDGEKVNLVFLLVGKDDMVAPHIKLLSRISRMMNNDEFRENLSKTTSAEEIYELFKKEEEKYLDLS